jgi:Tfp pilus assembly protein PilZ
MEIKITEQRRPRIEAQIRIGKKQRGFSHETYMGNISQSGIFLETPKPFAKVGEKVDLQIKLPNSTEKIGVQGKVVRIVGPNQVGVRKGVGIEFLKIETKQTKLFNSFLEELISAKGMGCRKYPRIDTKITVEFKNPREMGKALSNNLSQGGIFIETKAQFNLGSTVTLDLIHPLTGENLELDGEIIHIRKSLNSKDSSRFSDGIGICFQNVDRTKKEKINYFLKSLLIQKKKRKTRGKSR